MELEGIWLGDPPVLQRSSSEQAAGCGEQRPPSHIKVRLQSESYFASQPEQHAKSIPLFTRFCQICSVRVVPRAPHTLRLDARAQRFHSHHWKADGALFLSYTSPAIRLCSQDVASYTMEDVGRQLLQSWMSPPGTTGWND